MITHKRSHNVRCVSMWWTTMRRDCDCMMCIMTCHMGHDDYCTLSHNCDHAGAGETNFHLLCISFQVLESTRWTSAQMLLIKSQGLSVSLFVLSLSDWWHVNVENKEIARIFFFRSVIIIDLDYAKQKSKWSENANKRNTMWKHMISKNTLMLTRTHTHTLSLSQKIDRVNSFFWARLMRAKAVGFGLVRHVTLTHFCDFFWTDCEEFSNRGIPRFLNAVAKSETEN